MQRTRPFARFHAVMAVIASLLAASNNPQAMAQGKGMSRQEAFSLAGGYKSRGKGRQVVHYGTGTRAYQRAALKKRNRKAHRAACRG